MRNRVTKTVAATLFAITTAAASASAGVIVAPVSGTANVPTSVGSIDNTRNQSGLSAGYVSGVTIFQSYINTNPFHSTAFSTEWHSAADIMTAEVTYDLGSAMQLGRMALWNEDAYGIKRFDLKTSLDGISFATQLTGQVPTDHGLGSQYFADLFLFADTTTRFVRLSITSCGDLTEFPGSAPSECSIGEVAFERVPEPSLLALIGIAMLSLFGMGWLRRRQA